MRISPRERESKEGWKKERKNIQQSETGGMRAIETKAWQVRSGGKRYQENRNITADFGTERGSALVSPHSVIKC